MLSCAEFLAEFGDYLEGTPDGPLRSKLEAHLGECRTCQVILDSTRKTVQIVTDAGSFDLPDTLLEPIVEQVMSRIREEAPHDGGKQA
jgi:hypothetical protein